MARSNNLTPINRIASPSQSAPSGPRWTAWLDSRAVWSQRQHVVDFWKTPAGRWVLCGGIALILVVVVYQFGRSSGKNSAPQPAPIQAASHSLSAEELASFKQRLDENQNHLKAISDRIADLSRSTVSQEKMEESIRDLSARITKLHEEGKTTKMAVDNLQELLDARFYTHLIAKANSHLARSDRTLALACLERVPKQFRTQWEWQYLRLQCEHSAAPFRDLDHAGLAKAAAVNPDNGQIVTGDNMPAGRPRAGGTFHFWDPDLIEVKVDKSWSKNNPRSMYQDSIRFVENQNILAIDFVDDGDKTLLAAARQNGTKIIVGYWDVKTGDPIGIEWVVDIGHAELKNASSIAFHPKKREFAVTKLVRAGKPPTIARYVDFKPEPIVPEDANIAKEATSVSYDRQGNLLMTRDDECFVATHDGIWNYVARLSTGSGQVGVMAPGGKFVAVARKPAADGTRIVISTFPEDRLVANLSSPRRVSSIAFLDETRLLAGTESGEIEIWDFTTNELLLVLRGGGGAVAHLAADKFGRILSTHADAKTRVWLAQPK